MRIKIFILFMLLAILFLAYNYIEISKFSINKPVFSTKKLKKDLKITQITDYHNNTLIDKEKLLEEIKKFSPHIIVLTGDMIDYKTEDMDGVLEFIKKLYEINNNIYFVIGNHELRNKKGLEFISKVEEIGVNLLDNENTTININEDIINIVGLNYFISNEEYKEAIKGIDNGYFTLVLSHSPSKIIPLVSGIEDLILSGHTHGGQVRLPIIGAVVSSSQGLFPEYDKGTFKLGNTYLYIDSGLGNSVLPIRMLNRVQISNITIEGEGKNN